MHHLNKDIDSDLPIINEYSAFAYIKDAFGISESKHSELLEKVKMRELPEIGVHVENPTDDNGNLQPASFCFVPSKVDNFEALEAHCSLLKILMKHELELSQTPHFYWSGKFSLLASTLLHLHAEFRLLSDIDIALSKWSAYTEIHRQHPLDLKVFTEILDAIIENFNHEELPVEKRLLFGTAKVFIPACFGSSGAVLGLKEESAPIELDQLKTKDEKVIAMFWHATKILTESFGRFISELNIENDLENIKIEILRKIFIIINKVKRVEQGEINTAFEESIKTSVAHGTSKYLLRTLNRRNLKIKNNETRLDELIKFLEASTADFLKLSDRFGFIFEE